ncbi:hypothetical protein PbDSM24746_62430 [Paenibacillus macerans]|nr:hypothetical protein PbDSM24746_62430 [Paenibacillus macerans]GBK72595.1 hypothetical protein PbJCM17693_63030 [Paenibacillus macerans]
MMLGNNTLQTAIADPSMAVPRYKSAAPDKERITMPTIKNRRAINMMSSAPNFRPNLGTRGDNKAKASKGTVVIKPARVFEI